MLSPSFPFLILSFSHARHPSSFVPYRLHLLHGGLHIWGIRENNSAVDVQATGILLVSTIFNRNCGPPKKVSVIQPHQAASTTVPRVNWTTMKWRSGLCNQASQKGLLALRNGEGEENFPRERWKLCRQELCMHSHSFSSITPLTYIAARVADLDSLAQHYHHSLLPPPLFATNLSRCRSSWFQQNQEAVDWTSRSPPERTQCRQGRMGSTSYHCSMRGDCSTNWNSLSMQVNPQALPSCDVSVPFMILSLSAPLLKPRSSSTKGRFCTSRTRGDSEGVQQRWQGQWVRRVGRVCRHVTAISIG